MNEILTAKEWLKREIEEHTLMGWDNSVLMERYANYKNGLLEGKILEFRSKFKDVNMLQRIDEHFGITSLKEGKIN